jgi:hypothetical protein
MYGGGYYTLFYSGSVYSKPSYAIGTARGKSMTEGPWEKNPKNPILRSTPGAGEPKSTLHFGPGPGLCPPALGHVCYAVCVSSAMSRVLCLPCWLWVPCAVCPALCAPRCSWSVSYYLLRCVLCWLCGLRALCPELAMCPVS